MKLMVPNSKQRRSAIKRVCSTCLKVFASCRGAVYCSRSCAQRARPSTIQEAEAWWENSRGYIVGRVVTAQGIRKVKQHRFVMECLLGRYLNGDEDVHHINGDKTDNRPENLELLNHGLHSSLTGLERVHPKGYRLRLSEEERQRRSDRLRERHLATRLAASLSDGAAQPNEEERSALYVKLIERAVG